MNVTIPYAEYKDIYQLAHRRNKPWSGAWAEDSHNKMDLREARFLHLIGLCGEWATAKLLGGIDVSRLAWHEKGDRGAPDLWAMGGRVGIEVKTRMNRTYEFSLASADVGDFQADIGVLVVPANEIVEVIFRSRNEGKLTNLAYQGKLAVDVVGYITQYEFPEKSHYDDFGFGQRLAVHTELLHKITKPATEEDVLCWALGTHDDE